MSEQVACFVKDLKAGSALQTDLTQADGSDAPVAVVRTEDGEFYAIGGLCSHGEVPLGEGDVEGPYVECWAHGSRFDVRTGVPADLPAMDPVATYPVRIDGERVLVDVDNPKTS
jgi:3-phenylpropionate/trans-cinnamate dioxygenase ferredoxin subunit